MSGLNWKSAADLAQGYAAGQFLPPEVLADCMAQAARLEPVLNALVPVDPAAAQAQAEASAARWRAGAPLGPLDGVPVLVKDLLLTQGQPTLRGSWTVDAAGPWTDDAPAVARLTQPPFAASAMDGYALGSAATKGDSFTVIGEAGAGHAFAGLPRVMALVEHLKDHPAGGPITVTDRGPSSVVIDGGGNNGYVTSIIGIDKALELARASGVGVVGIKDTWFSGRLAYYVERAARQGFVAFHTASTQARVAPAGGIDRIFGTNPVAFAFPCDPEPLVIDFGTAVTFDVISDQPEIGRAHV